MVANSSVAMEDLAQYGVFKPEKEHGYASDEMDQFLAEDKHDKASSSTRNAQDAASPVMHEGREYLKRADPSGRRNGLGTVPSDS